MDENIKKFLDKDNEVEFRIIDFETDTDTQELFKFVYKNQKLIGLVREGCIHYTRVESTEKIKFIREVHAANVYNVPVVYKELIIFYIEGWCMSGDIYNKFDENIGWEKRAMLH